MRDPDCLFCKIAAKEIPATIVYEDDQIMAFRDIHPKAPTHILIIPKEHIPCFSELQPEHGELIAAIHRVAVTIAEDEGLTERGFRVVVNNGVEAGQEVYHLHYHLLGGRAFAWPPG